VSISGTIDRAVDRAIEKGCNTFQIFTKNPRAWRPKTLTLREINTFVEKVSLYNTYPVFGHMPYLPNLASAKKDVYRKSVQSLSSELHRCERLKIPYLVTHLGSHLGAGKPQGFERIIKAINLALSQSSNEVMLLLENTAGTKNSMGGSFEDIKYMIDHAEKPDHIGVCFDTCHGFASGYDLRTKETVEAVISEFDSVMGFETLKAVHLNDSLGDLGSRIDRHEHIGLGKIGEDGFRNMLKSEFRRLPLILETPIDDRRTDTQNLQKVRELAGEIQPNCRDGLI